MIWVGRFGDEGLLEWCPPSKASMSRTAPVAYKISDHMFRPGDTAVITQENGGS
jgi:hypothetical protein